MEKGNLTLRIKETETNEGKGKWHRKAKAP